ncbi:uncharacterized protein LOC126678074 [Mercurialis annua]|uniref:uncharacterized protein LOC126678074 n=1 Tax=Mercurialis annua TaxID=3986 RepID=UPI00215ECFEC|nr:uncharacterized protein LOC126678074 [Mercurialis annua]
MRRRRGVLLIPCGSCLTRFSTSISCLTPNSTSITHIYSNSTASIQRQNTQQKQFSSIPSTAFFKFSPFSFNFYQTMNSMFSSFDILWADLLGQSIRSAFASNSATTHDLISDTKPNSQQQQQQPPMKAQRFAPELDGLHCFETLVNY